VVDVVAVPGEKVATDRQETRWASVMDALAGRASMLLGSCGCLPTLPASALVNGAAVLAGRGFAEFDPGMVGIMLKFPQVANLGP
jgi:hypothetical protein